MGSSMLHVAQCEMAVAAVAILILFTIIVDGAPLDKNCTVSRCSKRGPSVRFPFWLKHNNTTGQPEDHCSYPPGFQLSCRHGKTILEFQDLVNTSIKGLQVSLGYKAVVLSIDYTYNYILLEDTLISTSNAVPVYSASVRNHIPQAQYNYDYYNCYNYGEQFSHSHYTYFNCSPSSLAVTSMSPTDEFRHISSLSTKGFQVYASPSYRNTIQMLHEIRSCTKMYNISLDNPPLYSSV